MLELKARQGVDYRLWVWLPRPAKAATNVALAVRAPVPFTAAAMTRVGLTATVTSISADRRTLTLSAPAAALNGAVGQFGGHAWLKPDSGPAYAVQVIDQPTLSTLTMAEPLPPGTIVTSAALSWEVYHATVTALTATATVKRNIPWTITWTSSRGTGMGDETERQEGLLHVVRQPFQTGLTTRLLLEICAGFGVQVPRRQESWEPQIAAAERQLIRWLRRDTPQPALGEDAYNGAAFCDVQAMLTVAIILSAHTAVGMARSEPRDDYRAQAVAAYDQIMLSPPWLDLDGDGVVDPGEADTQVGDFAGDAGGNIVTVTTAATAPQRWERGFAW